VSPYVWLVFAFILPTAAVYALICGARLLRWAGEQRARARPPVTEPIERLAATLRRLRAELEDMETRSGVPAKNLRVQALRAAYVDALGTACQRLEISPLRHDHASQAEIYRVEAALRQAGLDVRSAPAH
jgi:hypothetical protein